MPAKKLKKEIRDMLAPFVTEEMEEAIKFHKRHKGRSEGMLDGSILKERMFFYKMSEDRLARLLKLARDSDLTDEAAPSVPEHFLIALKEFSQRQNEAYDRAHPPQPEK